MRIIIILRLIFKNILGGIFLRISAQFVYIEKILLHGFLDSILHI